MKILFAGADREVTGSRHVVMVGDKKILLDCGLHQGNDRDANRESNENFVFKPSEIDFMILSHAHIDHCGLIPKLVKDGFGGKIFTSLATRDIAEFLLLDAAHIQEYDAANARKHGREVVEPFYDEDDVNVAMSRFKTVDLGKWTPLFFNVDMRLVEAGHVFGSAQVQIRETTPDGEKIITFTGDLGRNDMPIVSDPVRIERSDVLITESTYGNRLHEPYKNMGDSLAKIVNETMKNGGKIIIPAFAFERAQEVIIALKEMIRDGKIPALPTYVDSPLATNITNVFRSDTDFYDDDTRKMLESGKNPFEFESLHFTQSVDESKALNFLDRSCVIIAAAGMCNAGRIVHHLFNNIEDPKNAVVFVGYNVSGTLGRRIEDGEKEVRILGEMKKVNAKVFSLSGFSAHADADDLIKHVREIKGLKKVFVVHGDPEQMDPFAEKIRAEKLADEVITPERGEIYSI